MERDGWVTAEREVYIVALNVLLFSKFQNCRLLQRESLLVGRVAHTVSKNHSSVFIASVCHGQSYIRHSVPC